MADLRLSSLSPVATPNPAAARTSEGTRAAQRAFFNAALANVQAPAAVASAPAPAVAAPPRPAAAPSLEAPLGRTPRPGSLLDIRV